MSTNKRSSNALITITSSLAALADGAWWQLAAIDLSTLRYLDLMLQLSFTLAAPASSADKEIKIYTAASLDGTLWPDAVAGTDGSFTPHNVRNLMELGTIVCPGSGTGPFTGCFRTVGGPDAALALPDHVVILIRNMTGVAFAASGHTLKYRGVQISEE